MGRILFILREVFCAAILLLPVFLVLNRSLFRDGKKTAAYFLFDCYLSGIYALVGLPNVTYVRLELKLNWIPFRGMIGDLKNSILNVALFLPLGMFLPVLWKKYRVMKRTVLFGFGLSLTIELLQILTLRATDVNDLITNTLGMALGFLLSRCVRSGGGEQHRELYLLLAVTFGVMFFAHPFLSNLAWKLLN